MTRITDRNAPLPTASRLRRAAAQLRAKTLRSLRRAGIALETGRSAPDHQQRALPPATAERAGQLQHLEVRGHDLLGFCQIGGDWLRVGTWRDRGGRFVAELEHDEPTLVIEAASLCDLCRLVDAELARFAV